jgi:hypothetical protein
MDMEPNIVITSSLVLVGLPIGAAFLGRRRISACMKSGRWLEALAVLVGYCLVIALPFVIASRIATDPNRAPFTVINLLVVAVCIDGVIRRLRPAKNAR